MSGLWTQLQTRGDGAPCGRCPSTSSRRCSSPRAPPSHSATSSCLQIITENPPYRKKYRRRSPVTEINLLPPAVTRMHLILSCTTRSHQNASSTTGSHSDASYTRPSTTRSHSNASYTRLLRLAVTVMPVIPGFLRLTRMHVMPGLLRLAVTIMHLIQSCTTRSHNNASYTWSSTSCSHYAAFYSWSSTTCSH